MPHFVGIYLYASRPSVTDQDKSFSAPVLSKCFVTDTAFFTTIIKVYHSHFPLDCEPSELCGLLNDADVVMILSWTVTILLFEMEEGEAGPLEL